MRRLLAANKSASVRWLVFFFFCALAPAAAAASNESNESIEVTATRMPEQADQVPAEISLISGEELAAHSAADMRTALSLVPGVEAPPGGDAGPSNAIPSFWGLHEFDAFLLVVDGVPWGGAFNPSIPTLDLNDVQRIEVMKGAAPVIYGATSFVGVVQVIHYPAGQASSEIDVAAGNYDSFRGSAALALPSSDSYQHSLLMDGQKLGFADKREEINEGHALYRASMPLAGGTLGLDADLTVQHDIPPSQTVRQGAALTTLTPRNANYNPADAKINDNQYHATLSYSHDTSLGIWNTKISFAHTDIRDICGFLRADLTDNGSENADSQNQRRHIDDLYFDSHFEREFVPGVSIVYGADLLYGLGKQQSANGAYYVPLNGLVTAPSTTSLHVDEINIINDRRVFAGQYAQLDWKFEERWDVLAGLRLNETYEKKASAHIDGFDPGANESANPSRSTVKLAGTIGASYRAWISGTDEAVLYTDYRNAFKPAALDFGPDYTPDVLNPETVQSYEAGLKGTFADGRLDYQAEYFDLNFENLVVATTDLAGDPMLVNAGKEHLKGFEIETRYHATEDVMLAANFSYHDARFVNTVLNEDGSPVDVSGKQLTLSPRILASGGIIYAPPEGPHGSIVINYVGRRYLDEANTARAPSYTTIDATIGYRFGPYDFSIVGYNLSNERPPVTQSEFGDSSYYLLPARAIFVKLGWAL